MYWYQALAKLDLGFDVHQNQITDEKKRSLERADDLFEENSRYSTYLFHTEYLRGESFILAW